MTAMLQTLIDPAMPGRVMSLYMTVAMLVSPVGLLVAGPLAEMIDVAGWFALSGAPIADGARGLVAPGGARTRCRAASRDRRTGRRRPPGVLTTLPGAGAASCSIGIGSNAAAYIALRVTHSASLDTHGLLLATSAYLLMTPRLPDSGAGTPCVGTQRQTPGIQLGSLVS